MLTGSISASGQKIWSSSATQIHALGDKLYGTGGRVYRYVKNGGTALGAGFLVQSPAIVANHLAVAVAAAAAIGDKTVTVTLGNTAATLNQYQDGWLNINTTPGEGYAYRIKSHPAADAAASLTVTLYDEDALQVALTTSSVADLVLNPYNGVIVSPTSLTGTVMGVAVYPLTASEYGWIQTGGPASVSVEGTPAAGVEVVVPADTAGQAKASADDASGLVPVGRNMITGVDELKKMVFLTLDA